MHKSAIAMNTNHHLLLAQVASLYYEQGLTQTQIGEKLGLSRVKIYRLLKEAKEKQVVQIKISWPIERNLDLEAALKGQFKLNKAFVLKQAMPDRNITLLPQLGQLGAQYLEKILQDNMTLAICMGRSTYEVIQAISPDFQANVRVAQATGSLPFTIQELDSATLARRLARKLGGEVHYLSSPLIADSVEAAEVLRNQPDIKQTLTAAGQADVVLIGIGNLNPDISNFAKTGFMSPEILAELQQDGAIGDMAGQIFTATGETYQNEFNQRIIGITLDDLRQIPTVIAIAAGKEKAPAILGGLHTQAIDALCTDDQTAREILSLNDN